MTHQRKHFKVETALYKFTILLDICSVVSASESLALTWKDTYILQKQAAFYHLLMNKSCNFLF